jgi:hypothetical protein
MTDKYSEIIKNKIAEYESLSSKGNKTMGDIQNINQEFGKYID